MTDGQTRRRAAVAGGVLVLLSTGCDGGGDGTRHADVPEGALEDLRSSTDCESLRHEADVMRDRIDRGSDGELDRAALEAATERLDELGCDEEGDAMTRHLDGCPQRRRNAEMRIRGCGRLVPAPVPGPTIARPVDELELEDGSVPASLRKSKHGQAVELEDGEA